MPDAVPGGLTYLIWLSLCDNLCNKKGMIAFILKWRKLKVSLVARMLGSSPGCPPWKFICHLWAVEGIGEEVVTQSCQEHLRLWGRIPLLGFFRPFAFFWNGSLSSGRGGECSPEDLAVGSHLPRFIKMASVLDWRILSPGVCPLPCSDWLTNSW